MMYVLCEFICFGTPIERCMFQVNHILRTYEHSQDFYEGSVKSYDSNQLPSNYPMEDSRSEASSLFSSSKLFSTLDSVTLIFEKKKMFSQVICLAFSMVTLDRLVLKSLRNV